MTGMPPIWIGHFVPKSQTPCWVSLRKIYICGEAITEMVQQSAE